MMDKTIFNAAKQIAMNLVDGVDSDLSDKQRADMIVAITSRILYDVAEATRQEEELWSNP